MQHGRVVIVTVSSQVISYSYNRRDELRQPEVQNLGLTLGCYEDIRRFDVAVDDPFLVAASSPCVI